MCVVVPWKYVAANLANLYSERSSSSSSGRGNAVSRSSSSSSFCARSRSWWGRTCQALSMALNTELPFPFGPDFCLSDFHPQRKSQLEGKSLNITLEPMQSTSPEGHACVQECPQSSRRSNKHGPTPSMGKGCPRAKCRELW